jgi:hypothetical protein
MEDNLDKKTESKDKVIILLKKNKLKVIYLLVALLAISTSIVFFKINNDNKNILIAEKYVQANLYLAAKDNVKSKIIYEEIILSKNKFYSILALNGIIENNLETNEEKILNYFKSLEKIKKTKEQNDLLDFKKSLYLIKIAKVKEGNDLLKKLINSKSKYKTLAETIIDN